MTFKGVLQKLQSQSEVKRKIILWGTMGVIGVALLAWWISNVKHSLEGNQGPSIEEQLQIDKLQERFNEIPVKFDGEQQ